MFGLMKNAGCQNTSQPEWYRLHYCGLCKSIGRKYDQKSRLMLNYDAVFLAEILSLLSVEETKQWDKKIQSYQCFSLPGEAGLPISLDYASDVNMLLAQLKMQDNKLDDLKMLWSTVEKMFRKPFGRIQPLLQKWQVDENTFRKWLAENLRRETSPLPSGIDDWQLALNYYSEPTANITGYFFALGADAIDKPEVKAALYDLGYRFGGLIYSLDAVKDFAEDMERGQFNPLSAFFGPKRSQDEMLATAKDRLWDLSSGIEQCLQTLPIPTDLQKAFQGRLVLNLSRELSGQAPPCPPSSSGIEKSTVPRFYRFLDSVFARFNPAYPGKFALSYLIFLGVFFSEKLMASIALVAKQTPEKVDWAFLIATASFPVLAYLGVKRIKKWRVVLWLKKIKEKIKKKIEFLKKETGWNTVLIVVLVILLLLVIIGLVLLGKAANSCGNTCENGCEDDCCSSTNNSTSGCGG
jgi:hypothetical protein